MSKTGDHGRNQLIYSGWAKWYHLLLYLTNTYVFEILGGGNCPIAPLWLRASGCGPAFFFALHEAARCAAAICSCWSSVIDFSRKWRPLTLLHGAMGVCPICLTQKPLLCSKKIFRCWSCFLIWPVWTNLMCNPQNWMCWQLVFKEHA